MLIFFVLTFFPGLRSVKQSGLYSVAPDPITEHYSNTCNHGFLYSTGTCTNGWTSVGDKCLKRLGPFFQTVFYSEVLEHQSPRWIEQVCACSKYIYFIRFFDR